jgi:hypothetical protein
MNRIEGSRPKFKPPPPRASAHPKKQVAPKPDTSYRDWPDAYAEDKRRGRGDNPEPPR